VKTYKTNNFLLRTNVNNTAKDLSLKIWDEHENMLSHTDIKKENSIIAIVEVVGLKFSTSNFQLVLQLKQLMKFDDEKRFSKCLIKTNHKKESYVNMTNEYTKEKNDDFSDIHNELNNEDANTQDNDEKNEEDESSSYDVSSDEDESSYYSSSEYSSGYSSCSDDENKEDEYDNSTQENVSQKEIIEEPNEEIKVPQEALQLDNNVQEKDIKIPENIEQEKNMNEKNLNEKIENIMPEKKQEPLEKNEINDKIKSDILEEVDLEISSGEVMTLKKKKDIYIDIYKKALDRARNAKKKALKAYFIANRIKKEYLLDDIESSDVEDLENFSE
jgi:hypothetical protein